MDIRELMSKDIYLMDSRRTQIAATATHSMPPQSSPQAQENEENDAEEANGEPHSESSNLAAPVPEAVTVDA